MSRFTTQTITSADGTLLHAEATGDNSKPAIVFVHGFCCTAEVFNDIFAESRLLQHFYLVRYDDRGHGRSGKPTEEGSYASIKRAQDFEAVSKAFALERPFFAGWSLGSTFATDVVQHLGAEYLSGLIYLAGLPGLGDITPRVALSTIINFIGSFILTDDVERGLSSRIGMARSLSVNPDAVPYSTMLSWIGGATLMNPIVAQRILSSVPDVGPLAEAGRTGKLPLLIIHGTEDLQISVEKVLAEESVKGFKDLTVKIVPGAGHIVFYDAYEETVEAILEFTQRVLKV